MRDRGMMRDRMMSDIIVMNDSVHSYADPASCLQSVPSPGTCCLSYLSLEMEDRLGPGLYPHQHQHQLHPGDSRAPAHPRSSGAETFALCSV